MQCILVKSDEFENSHSLLYILLKSSVCCNSLAALGPQQLCCCSLAPLAPHAPQQILTVRGLGLQQQVLIVSCCKQGLWEGPCHYSWSMHGILLNKASNIDFPKSSRPEGNISQDVLHRTGRITFSRDKSELVFWQAINAERSTSIVALDFDHSRSVDEDFLCRTKFLNVSTCFGRDNISKRSGKSNVTAELWIRLSGQGSEREY